MVYKSNDYSRLLGTAGFSDLLLKNHFTLYEGYVTNVNKLIDLLKTTEPGTPQYAEMKRRFGWEFNGMRLHDYYFGCMTKGGSKLNVSSKLMKQIVQDFGSYEAWEKDFKGTGSSRGIGWAILAFDKKEKRLFNIWVNEHDFGHLAGAAILLTLDVFEHAYMVDYGLKKADYIVAFMNAVDWKAVENNFDSA
jgi:Fe-Mn family superoxide dismutase